MTSDRILAADLFDVLESMLYIAIHGLQDSPRRDSVREKFIDVVERIKVMDRK